MNTTKKLKEICPTTTMSRLTEGAILVDVRETNEVNELAYDVQNIMLLPLSEFEERFQELPQDKALIMACKSGGRSLKATAFLLHNGFENVSNMEGGIMKWVNKGFPTKGDTTVVTQSECCSQSGCC